MKRRVYLLSLPFGAACCTLIWWLNARNGSLHIVDQIGLPLLGSVFLLLAVGVYYWPKRLSLYELTLFSSFSLMYLASLGYSLLMFTNSMASIWNLAGLGSWGTVLYTLAFLVFGVKRGLWFSLGLYSLSLLASLSYFLLVPPADFVMGTKALLFQRLAADGLVLFLLSAIGQVVAAQASATTQLTQAANTDPLTRLGNRRHITRLFDQESARIARQGGTLALALVDIDFFKQVNDQHGHAVGDQTLVEVGNLLQQQTRTLDGVGRWGGEEFVLLLPGLPLAQAYEAVERLRAQVATYPFQTVGSVTTSCGVAEYRVGEPLGALLQRADVALLEAKAAGRNLVVAEVGSITDRDKLPGELLN